MGGVFDIRERGSDLPEWFLQVCEETGEWD